MNNVIITYRFYIWNKSANLPKQKIPPNLYYMFGLSGHADRYVFGLGF